MAKVRVYELAKELGVDSMTLMRKLHEYGELVRSASSTIEPPIVRKLRAAYAEEPPVPPSPTRPFRRRHNPYAPSLSPRRLTPARSIRSDVLDAAEQMFGPEAARKVRAGATDGPFGRDGYDFSWKKHFIEREVYEQFIAAGVGYEQAELAAECLAAGLRPADLVMGLGDRTVLGWLREGHPAAKVAKTLRECREDPRSAHLVDERARNGRPASEPAGDQDLEPPELLL